MLQAPALDVHVAVEEPPVGLQAVAQLFDTLRQRGIRYCHWKSNVRLEHGLRGQTDMDLLVDRTHSDAFRQVLGAHGVKPVCAAPGKHYPAVENHLGFDPASGRLFHLHVHYQLVLGEQFVKNYRLPLEQQFLDDVQLRHGVRIPAPELEIIVLSLRALLKYRDRDVVKDVLRIRSSGLPEHILDEISGLLKQTSIERVAGALEQIGELVPSDVVLALLRTVTTNPRDGLALFRLRRRARQALRRYQRHDRLRATLSYAQALWRRRPARFRRAPARGMTLPGGGVTLALVGADGAGKSTACQALAKWLAWKLDVRVFYLGSKQPSRRSQLLYGLFRVARRGQRTLGRRLGQGAAARWAAGLRDTLLHAHQLSIGHDRYERFRAGQEQALAGSVVIFDRFPLASLGLRGEQASMDGPRIPAAGANAITGVLARAERRLYQDMRPPDYLCVLEVSPDISLQRKPDHQRAAIEAKSLSIGALLAVADREGRRPRLIRIDADLPFEEVLRQLKASIWALL